MAEIDELTRRAAEELMKEAQDFVKKRDVRYKEPEKKAPTLRPNTRFLKNVVLRNITSNKSKSTKRKCSESVSSIDQKKLYRNRD